MSVSRVPGAPPRWETPPVALPLATITVVPVEPPVATDSVYCPTSMPCTSVIAFSGPGAWAQEGAATTSAHSTAAHANVVFMMVSWLFLLGLLHAGLDEGVAVARVAGRRLARHDGVHDRARDHVRGGGADLMQRERGVAERLHRDAPRAD